MRTSIALVLILFVLASAAVGASREGTLEGTFKPPDTNAQVSALQEGKVIAATRAGGLGERFRLGLASGTYTIVVTTPVSSFPIRLDGVVVKEGETTTLPQLLIMPGSGKAVLEGRVVPPRPDSEITLLSEGKERSAARTDSNGRYEFRGIPAGSYEVRASAAGYAADVAPVAVPENQRVQHTSVLLPAVATDGVDWAAGKVRATGIGSPPKEAQNAAESRAMTERAAIADAQRNLLRTVEQIKIDGNRTVGTMMRNGNGTARIQGFVRHYTVVSERLLEDGRIEVVLELPLTGAAGLSRYITE